MRNRICDLSRRSAGAAIGAALTVGLLFAASAGAAAPNTWSAVGSLASARAFPAAALLPGGEVIVAGGTDGTALSSSEIFDSDSDTWSTGPTMSSPRVGAVAVALPDGDVLVAGGSSTGGPGGVLNTAEVYKPTQNTFTPVSNTMASGRYLAAATLLPDGDVLVVGGQDQNSNALSTADLYDPATNTFLTGAGAPPDMSAARELPMAATLTDGDVLVAGGADSNNAPLDTAEVYDPSSNSWTPVSNTMSTPRLAGGIASLRDGRELLVGGESAGPSNSATTATTDFYSPTTNSFTPGPAMAAPRLLFGIDDLADGRVLVAGGAATNNGTTGFLNSAEVFDPTTDQWSATSSLPQPNAEFATAVLPDGQVLAAGGTPDAVAADATTRTLLYTPAVVPTAPVAVSAAAGSGSALVTFAPPANDGGAPITAYTITASTGQMTTTPDARTFATVSGLTNGTAVTFTVRALNAEGTGPASAASNSVTPTSPAVPAAPDTAPTLRFFGLPTHLTLEQFLKGLHFAVRPNKAASLQIMLRGTVNRAMIADAFDLTLAHKTLGMSAAKRTITLRPSRKLVGNPGRVKVELVVIARDAAGSRSTITRTISVRGSNIR